MPNLKPLLFASFLLGIAAASGTNAASTTRLFIVNRVVTDATQYNGCLVEVRPSPSAYFAECPFGFVTLGCDGLAGPTKSAAALNLSQTQLGLVSQTKVYIRIYNVAPEGNAYCLADRVDTTAIPNSDPFP